MISRPARKQVPTPPEPASDAGLDTAPDHLLCTQGVRGSNPLVSTKKPCIGVFPASPRS
jgi:hypothetical protein